MRSTFFVLLLLAFPFCSPAAPTDDPDVKGAERLFTSWIRGQLAYRNLPGLAVGVVSDQQLVWAQGFGFADVDKKTPMTPATKFRMASHSKLFTATAIMQLRDAGKVHLDDAVSAYLPWFHISPADADDPAITIEELLTHSAGLPREAGPHWSELSFPDAEGVQTIRQNTPGGILAGDSLEIFEFRIYHRGHGGRSDLRREVGRLRTEPYL